MFPGGKKKHETQLTALPAGWRAQESRSSGETYYVNEYTEESTYDVPTAPAQQPVYPGKCGDVQCVVGSKRHSSQISWVSSKNGKMKDSLQTPAIRRNPPADPSHERSQQAGRSEFCSIRLCS